MRSQPDSSCLAVADMPAAALRAAALAAAISPIPACAESSYSMYVDGLAAEQIVQCWNDSSSRNSWSVACGGADHGHAAYGAATAVVGTGHLGVTATSTADASFRRDRPGDAAVVHTYSTDSFSDTLLFSFEAAAATMRWASAPQVHAMPGMPASTQARRIAASRGVGTVTPLQQHAPARARRRAAARSARSLRAGGVRCLREAKLRGHQTDAVRPRPRDRRGQPLHELQRPQHLASKTPQPAGMSPT